MLREAGRTRSARAPENALPEPSQPPESLGRDAGNRGPGSDPTLARTTTKLLEGCGFSTSFLRTLSELRPADRHDGRLIDEYRAALGRVDLARERMILSNMKLVIWQARKYRPGSMTLADLVQEGTIGLMKAVSKFDPFRGFRFATYALWWIRQSITRAIADKDRQIRLPVHALQHHRRIQRRLNSGESFGSLTGACIAADFAISPRLARGMLDVFFDAECAGGMNEVAGLAPSPGMAIRMNIWRPRSSGGRSHFSSASLNRGRGISSTVGSA